MFYFLKKIIVFIVNFETNTKKLNIYISKLYKIYIPKNLLSNQLADHIPQTLLYT